MRNRFSPALTTCTLPPSRRRAPEHAGAAGATAAGAAGAAGAASCGLRRGSLVGHGHQQVLAHSQHIASQIVDLFERLDGGAELDG